MNEYTNQSIDKVRKVLNRKCNMIFDRGYDDNKIIDLVDKNEDYFVIRKEDKRNFYKNTLKMILSWLKMIYACNNIIFVIEL